MIPSRPRWGRLQRGLEPPTSLGPQTELRDNLQLIDGDRVQLQQVLLNLIINAVEAMSALNEGPRELLISAGKAETGETRFRSRTGGSGSRASVRGLLHDQSERPGDGAVDLPLDHRGA
jgi:signal transduction histidine kinase